MDHPKSYEGNQITRIDNNNEGKFNRKWETEAALAKYGIM